MPISDLFTYPQLIFRIVEKKKRGSEYVFKSDTSGSYLAGNPPESRYAKQRKLHSKDTGLQAEIARFTFPTNKEGKTFYYNDYQLTMNLRTNVVDGVSGTIAEIYGRGIDEISMRGVFPKAGERSVILSTDWVPELKTYDPKDWFQSFKEFIQYFADLNDPYSRLWSGDPSYTVKAFGVGANFGVEQNKSLYEFQIIDEYAEQIFSVMPRAPKLYGNASQPLSYAWSIDFTVIEDKMQAPYKKIPDDVFDLAASFRMPDITEIPVIGTLTTLVDKTINAVNSISKIMATIASYNPNPKFAKDVMKYNSAYAQVVSQAVSMGAK